MFFQNERRKGNLVWLHAASVGELMSIIPLISKIEKNKKINIILVTTSTLSSSKIFKNFKFKKVVHQFFPIDFFYFTSKFLNYWKPSVAIFIDSEIWPCMFKGIKKKSIPLLLLNARLTPRSFSRWNYFNKLTNNIFKSIKIAYPQNFETEKFLKKLKVEKIKKIGNLKFCEVKNQKNFYLDKSFLYSIKKINFSASTHQVRKKKLLKLI